MENKGLGMGIGGEEDERGAIGDLWIKGNGKALYR